ncbi:HD domain-containing phosphohydrolase [Neptuniibacter sp. QD72_48]|uniref:HD domain-containing phosphohydrolase n=1 Tax=Neptuniibacter sp. QD72_48 TaxID=3398214 RepID=UPI0039F6375B
MSYPNNTILLVDDEQAVLNSLKRLLRPLKCKVLTTVSPNEALEILRENTVDILVSDMRMPEMGGEEFLEKAAKEFPDIERIVISGYAEAQAAIDAINRGKVSRFLLKPWEDSDVIKMVEKGFRLASLQQENERLQQETQEKNEQLEALNRSLDSKVQERTRQLKMANDRIKDSYRSVVRMFSTQTARRLGIKATKENRKLNQVLVAVAKKFGLEGQELKQLYYAWQLRQIGKLSFSDELLKNPYLTMETEQQRTFQQYPLLAQAALLLVKPLYPAGQIILQHKEYLDGSGYPKGLKGDQISIRAQILCVVNDYVEMVSGLYDERQYSTSEAIRYMQTTAVERYNQDVVEVLSEVIEGLSKAGDVLNDKQVSSEQLREGMKLSRDLISQEGILLLSADQDLDEVAIERIREMEFNLEEALEIYVSQK